MLAMTTSKGKVTIPLADFMSLGGISDESLLEMYMVYLRFNRETASFKLLLDMQWTKFFRGIRLHLTFDLSVNLDEVRLLIQPNVPPDVPPNLDRAVVPLWCVGGGTYTLISVVLIHQCLLGLLVGAPSLLCEGRGSEPPHGRG
jgi:hypothetical protein